MRLGGLALLAIAGLLSSLHSAAVAQDYPTRQINLIAPWPPGGAVDTLCRILGQKLTERLGKTSSSRTGQAPARWSGSPRPRGPRRTGTRW